MESKSQKYLQVLVNKFSPTQNYSAQKVQRRFRVVCKDEKRFFTYSNGKHKYFQSYSKEQTLNLNRSRFRGLDASVKNTRNFTANMTAKVMFNKLTITTYPAMI